jgi:hypothetical protein
VDAHERVREAARRYMINYENLTPTLYTRVEASGVLMTMRYLCNPQQRRGSEHDIWEDILEAFDHEDEISFAYPTQRIYYHPVENNNTPTSEANKLDME